ncbi:hypothetical protein WAB17_09515 [Parerythrobacter aurantius]|uniref:hypothetical protein n=1 Tax=Parerythrobacter aurantius TaxID=3127706 RepID=UPI003253CA87
MSRTQLLMMVTAAVALVTGTWTIGHFHTSKSALPNAIDTEYPLDGFDPNTPASMVNEKQLQKLAVSSCRCAGEAGESGENACWADYKAAISRFKVSNMASACMPVSSEVDCIATDQGEVCISTGFGIPGICTTQEAAAIEEAWHTAYDSTIAEFGSSGDEATAAAFEAGDAAVADAAGRIRNGETIAMTGRGGSCSG